MTEIESYWATRPDYRIDLRPCGGTARAWAGDVLLAESDACVVVAEQEHVDRLYFPEADVRWEHMVATDRHTVCPFKGRARYWTVATDPPLENVLWGYPTPFAEVGGIAGHVCFYEDRVRVELDEVWPGDPQGWVRVRRFPAWGTAADLVRLLDVESVGDGTFRAPGHPTSRNVVEGGQLLGQAIVAASKTMTDQRVTFAAVTFPKAAAFDHHLDIAVEQVRAGRSFSTVQVAISQHDSVRCAGTLLLAAEAPAVIAHAATMPDVAGPGESPPLDMGVVGRELRVVDGAYGHAPDREEPPVIHTWCRFRDDPGEPHLHAALLAQSTTHWTIAAAMRPHLGVSEADAHLTLSTGIMAVTIALHDDVDVRDWLLYSTTATWAGRGLAHGEGRVFTEAGSMVASYAVQAMIRPFATPPGAMGLDASTAM